MLLAFFVPSKATSPQNWCRRRALPPTARVCRRQDCRCADARTGRRIRSIRSTSLRTSVNSPPRGSIPFNRRARSRAASGANHPTNSGRFIRYAAISSSTSNDERVYRWPAQQLQSVDCFGNLHATERRGISQIHLPARGNALAEHRLSLAPEDTADWLYCGGCPNVSPLRWFFGRHLGSACPPPTVTNSPAHTAPAVSRNLA